MKNQYFIIISMVAIIIVGSIGLGLSFQYTPDTDRDKKERGQRVIAIAEEITDDHELATKLVNHMIETYEEGDRQISALDGKLGFKVSGVEFRYGFVIDGEKIVAHFNPTLIGENSFAIINSEESEEMIKDTLNYLGEVWVHYDFENPETGKVEPKTSLFKMHDGYIFGSGFYG